MLKMFTFLNVLMTFTYLLNTIFRLSMNLDKLLKKFNKQQLRKTIA